MRRNVRHMPIQLTAAARMGLAPLILESTGTLSLHVTKRLGRFAPSDLEVEVWTRDHAQEKLLRKTRFAKGRRLVLEELPPGPVRLLLRHLTDGTQARALAQVVTDQARTVIVRF